MSEYRNTGKIGEAAVKAYKAVEDKFVQAFLEKDDSQPSGYTLKTGRMAEKATSAYKKVEEAAVSAYKKVEDAFVEAFLEKIDNSEENNNPDKNSVETGETGE